MTGRETFSILFFSAYYRPDNSVSFGELAGSSDYDDSKTLPNGHSSSDYRRSEPFATVVGPDGVLTLPVSVGSLVTEDGDLQECNVVTLFGRDEEEVYEKRAESASTNDRPVYPVEASVLSNKSKSKAVESSTSLETTSSIIESLSSNHVLLDDSGSTIDLVDVSSSDSEDKKKTVKPNKDRRKVFGERRLSIRLPTTPIMTTIANNQQLMNESFGIVRLVELIR